MRNFLVFLAILVITIPILVIIQNIAGWELISGWQYFYLVLAFVILLLLYNKGKENKDDKVEK